VSSPISSDCGFSVAQGDPNRLDRASRLFGCTAEGVHHHGMTIETTATSLAPAWSGHAATAYLDLSRASSAVYRDAAAVLRTAAAVVRRYGAELARCRQEGITATRQAERCLAEIKLQVARLRDGERAVSAAQRSLTDATVRASHLLSVAMAAVAHAEEAAARAGLAQAQAEERAAGAAIARAREELAQWQAKGRRAWEDAQAAGAQASGGLGAVSISPPPVALPATAAALGPGVAAALGRGVAAALGAGAPARRRGSSRPRGGAHTPTRPHRKIVSGGAPLPAAKPGRGGAGQGSCRITIDPRTGTITTVTHTKSGATIETVTYTSTGATVKTITYPRSGRNSGSGVTIVNPGPAPQPHGRGTGSGTTTVG
jgi:hypothetical protein